MRVTLVIDALDAGGTQRFASNLVRGLVERNVEVSVMTLTGADEPDFFELPPKIPRDRLRFDSPRRRGVVGRVRRQLDSLRSLRRAVLRSEPDGVIALGWSTNVITLLSLRMTGLPVIISERVDPREHEVGRFWAVAQRLSYPFAAMLVVQTVAVERYMRSWVRRGRITTLPNPVASSLFEIERVPSPQPHIVAVGRLTPQKGFDTLLQAIAVVRRSIPETTLSIVGDGPQRAELERLNDRLDLVGSIVFHGTSTDPTVVTRTAWCGCLTSRHEGFPNALLEMMAIGLPVVSTNCRSGPSEMLAGGAGSLVPVDDVEALAAALTALLLDDRFAAEQGAAARTRAHTYEADRVVDRWLDVIAAAASKSRGARRR